MPLTNLFVQNVKPTDRVRRYTDGLGMYLEVAPSGGKYWRWKYRYDRREKRLALGVYPTVSLKEARERRTEARSLLSKNIDPAAHRHAVKAARAEAESWPHRSEQIRSIYK